MDGAVHRPALAVPFDLVGRLHGLCQEGRPRRVRIHCAVVVVHLGAQRLHGIMLVWARTTASGSANWVLLGYISAAFDGVSGVNGLSEVLDD